MTHAMRSLDSSAATLIHQSTYRAPSTCPRTQQVETNVRVVGELAESKIKKLNELTSTLDASLAELNWADRLIEECKKSQAKSVFTKS